MLKDLKQIAETWDESAVDLRSLLIRVEYDEDLMEDMLAVFAVEFPPIYRLLQEASCMGDTRQIEIHAHTLKGMLGSLSFARGTASAIRLERAAREGKTAMIETEVLALARETTAAQMCLEELFSGEKA